MNLVLFTLEELQRAVPRSDRRAQHVLNVLRRTEGDTFDAGIIDGPRGRATITQLTSEAMTCVFDAGVPASEPASIALVVGLPRPQTARDILRDATSVGVAALHFVLTEKSDPNYAQSTLWSSAEWQRQAIQGAEQAFDTRVPAITHGRTLRDTLTSLDPAAIRLALDNYEATAALSTCHVLRDKPVALAIGCERGWSAAERDLLRGAGFTLAHLGTRVLRTETAVIAALALVRAKLGLM